MKGIVFRVMFHVERKHSFHSVASEMKAILSKNVGMALLDWPQGRLGA